MADSVTPGSEKNGEKLEADKVNAPQEEAMSDSDVDQLISEEDPDFAKSIGEIGLDKDLSLSQILISSADQALSDEREAWQNSGRLGRIIYAIIPFAPHLSLRFKKIKFFLFFVLRAVWIRAKNFIYFLATDGKNKIFGVIGKSIESAQDRISESQRNFRYLSWKLKLSFFGIIALMVGTFFFIYQSFTKGVIPVGDELFIPSLEKVATQVEEYNPETEVEPFYENLRSSSNLLEIPKMVVNLVHSKNSGPNPMGIFEFYIEGMTPEVVIEIKDREVEVRDRMQRVLEEFTFDQVEQEEGKALMIDKLKRETNLLLTTGKIKKIWLKNIIVKP